MDSGEKGYHSVGRFLLNIPSAEGGQVGNAFQRWRECRPLPADRVLRGITSNPSLLPPSPILRPYSRRTDWNRSRIRGTEGHQLSRLGYVSSFPASAMLACSWTRGVSHMSSTDARPSLSSISTQCPPFVAARRHPITRTIVLYV